MTDEQMAEFLRIRDEKKDSNAKAAKYIASLNLFEEEVKEEKICQKKQKK